MHGVEFGAGTVFAGYRIDRRLGRGGMGTVYLAAHPRLPRQVALKLLNRELYSDPEVRGRFEREADVSAHLDHPGIVSVLDRGVEDGLMWISMQYVDGSDASVFRGTPLDPARATSIIAQTADALDYAHERGVLHRDVKPANILLAAARSGDRVLLTDFGIARLRGDARQLTRTGAFLATLAYASPEQLSGASVDHRSDQYSLGCTLFTLLTGESPFPADNPGAVVAAHLSKPVPPVSGAVPGLPCELDAVIARALAKNPAERFDSCIEFAESAVAALTSARVGDTAVTTGLPLAAGPREPSVPGWRSAAAARPDGSSGGPGQFGGRDASAPPADGVGADGIRDRVTVREGAPSAGSWAPAPVQGARFDAAATRIGPPEYAASRLSGYGDGNAVAAGRLEPRSVGSVDRTSPKAVSARWRALAVGLLVLAMVAGVGVVGVGAIYWKFVRPGRIAPPPTWGEHSSVYHSYAGVLPKDPTATGWSGARCFPTGAVVVQPGDPVPVRQITCTDSANRTAWYTEYATAADADTYLNRHGAPDPTTTRVVANGTVTAWGARPNEPFTLAVQRTVDGALHPVVIEVGGAPYDTIRGDWFTAAPF
ncbi:serine/threonine-protein kinase [Nocardia neocaledoniensis]|uniref:serine/threonine-protein kinase n=1 Tax=Nocardia neocaledoniensis TaxID=236511 RepID=UPI002454A30B|nr:serine/threonine-protein kinase [Nocardia neocaledoniensis]